MKRPLKTILLASFGVDLVAFSGVVIGFTNADRFIDGIHRSIPFTESTRCGPIWSVPFLLTMIAVGVAAAVFGRLATAAAAPDQQPPVLLLSRLAWIGGALTGAYWVVVLLGETMTGCSSGRIPH